MALLRDHRVSRQGDPPHRIHSPSPAMNRDNIPGTFVQTVLGSSPSLPSVTFHRRGSGFVIDHSAFQSKADFISIPPIVLKADFTWPDDVSRPFKDVNGARGLLLESWIDYQAQVGVEQASITHTEYDPIWTDADTLLDMLHSLVSISNLTEEFETPLEDLQSLLWSDYHGPPIDIDLEPLVDTQLPIYPSDDTVRNLKTACTQISDKLQWCEKQESLSEDLEPLYLNLLKQLPTLLSKCFDKSQTPKDTGKPAVAAIHEEARLAE